MVTCYGADWHGPELVVIASDSRFTWQATGQWWDVGEKVVQFAGNALLGYAGSVYLAKRVVRALVEAPVQASGRVLDPHTWLTGDSALNLVKRVLRQEDEKVKAEGLSREARRLQLLLAFADEHEHKVRLFRFDTGTEGAPYTPYELSGGVWPIGEAAARFHAVKKCEEMLKAEIDREQHLRTAVANTPAEHLLGTPELNPNHWVHYPVMGIEEAIRSGKYETIGGLVQVGAMTLQGFWQSGRFSVLVDADGNFDAPVVTERAGSGWVQKQGESELHRTEGNLPFPWHPEKPDTKPDPSSTPGSKE